MTGRKRHILVDTCGHLMQVIAHAADVSEVAGAKLLFAAMGDRFTRLEKLWCDGGYGKPDGDFVGWAAEHLGYAVEVVKRLADQVGFAVLPRRWVVEITQPHHP